MLPAYRQKDRFFPGFSRDRFRKGCCWFQKVFEMSLRFPWDTSSLLLLVSGTSNGWGWLSQNNVRQKLGTAKHAKNAKKTILAGRREQGYRCIMV